MAGSSNVHVKYLPCRSPESYDSSKRLLGGGSSSVTVKDINTREASLSTISRREKKGSKMTKRKSRKSTSQSSTMNWKTEKLKKVNLTKGLSPPKDMPKHRDRSTSPDKEKTLGEFDVTQWERTRWAEEYSKKNRISESQMKIEQKRSPQMSKLYPSKGLQLHSDPLKKETVTGTLVPGEARQVEQIRGKHLMIRPKHTLILVSIESTICAITLGVWSGVATNPLLPFLLTLINLLVVFCFICAVFFVELCRFQVKGIEEDSSLIKYAIPYWWRFLLLAAHVARAILICGCITIMALDNDFDGGSIATLAIQPLHLIVLAIQIFTVLRSQRNK